MKICVLGAGVIGVSAAFALGRAGHEVHVIDQAERAASGASAANGAQLSYSYVDPFASPSTLRQLPAYMSGLDPAVRLGFSLSPAYLSWGLKFLRECRSVRMAVNMQTRLALARKSQAAFQLFADTCDSALLMPTGQGKLVLAETPKKLEAMGISAKEKRALGMKLEVLSKDQALARDPALQNWRGTWAGGLFAQEDYALDPLQYCQVVSSASKTHYGVTFHFGEVIKSIQMGVNGVKSVETNRALHNCERIVICLGSNANDLLAGLGLKQPIYPVQGYSLTLPALPGAPKTSLTDLKHKIVFANLGDRMRIGGFMDVNQSPSKAEQRNTYLLSLARELWPGIADYDADPQFWTQYRPMTPSGVPIIRESKIPGIFLNVGHGALGYTFAAGSAMMIADLIGPETRSHLQENERTSHASII